MIVWRLADPEYARDLSGTGNRTVGGRWNSPGRGVVYCSENLSLCVLENIVHLPLSLRGRLPPRMAIKIELPSQAATDVNNFPKAIRGHDLDAWCKRIGDHWLESNVTLVMRAPSVVVEQEFNIMLNAANSGMSDVKILETRPFVFDERLTQEN